MALAALLTGGVGGALVWKVMESENQAYIQQSIGDSSLMMAAHFRSEFERFVEHIQSVGATQLHPLVNAPHEDPKLPLKEPSVQRREEALGEKPPEPEKPAGNSGETTLGLLETDPEILDISLWKKGEKSTTFDAFPTPKRVYLAMNPKYPDGTPDLSQQLQVSELSEKNLIQVVFQGKTLIFLSPVLFGQKSVIGIAAPLGGGAVDEVVVAHMRVDKFQKEFIGNRLVSGYLVDDAGSVIAKSGMQESELSPTHKEKMTQSPLFQTMHSSTAGSGQLSFVDENGNSLLAAATAE